MGLCLVIECGANVDFVCFSMVVTFVCVIEFAICVDCKFSCGNAVCGGDGCGGSCGICSGNSSCDNGQCQVVCVLSCSGQ